MTTSTAATQSSDRGGPQSAPGASRIVPSGLLGGIGGLGFVLLLMLQNGVRAGFPQPDANAAKVFTYYATHRGASMLLAAVFPFGALGLVLFVAAILTRVVDGKTRAAGFGGALAAAGLIAGFTTVTATDIALAEYIHRGHASQAVVDAMWVLHNAAFAVLFVWIGIALAGLTAAGAGAGLLSEAWKPAGLVGGICLLLGSAGAFGVLDGSPIFFVALVGFVVWAVFMVTASVKLLRDRHDDGIRVS